MRFPRLPDWVVYAAVVVAVLFAAAVGRAERTDAPPPPPSRPAGAKAPLRPASPFDPSVVVEAPATAGTGRQHRLLRSPGPASG